MMKHKKRLSMNLSELCGEPGPEDGIDPRELFKSNPGRKDHRKTRQLCKQVATTLEVEFAAHPDPVLRELHVVAVEPAPDSSHLVVLVAPHRTDGDVEESTIRASLVSAAGRLRSEVATAITRRRVPELSFRFLRAGRRDG